MEPTDHSLKKGSPDTDSPEDFLDEEGKWRCTSCGACCVYLHLLPLADTVEFDRGDGVCKKLNPDLTCSIYSSRPDWCIVNPTILPDYLHAAYCHGRRAWLKLQKPQKDR